MVDKITQKTGKAYGFFDCNATKEQINDEIPFIRKSVNTPSKLEITLTEDINSLNVDPKVLEIAQEAKESNMKYVMEATCQDYTNEKTADELSAVLNQAYQSPLYEKGEAFRGEIAYEKNGEYILKD